MARKRSKHAVLDWNGPALSKKVFNTLVDTTNARTYLVHSKMRALAPIGPTGSLRRAIGKRTFKSRGQVIGQVGVIKGAVVQGRDYLVEDYFGRVHFGFVGVDGRRVRKSGGKVHITYTHDTGGRYIVQKPNLFMFKALGDQKTYEKIMAQKIGRVMAAR